MIFVGNKRKLYLVIVYLKPNIIFFNELEITISLFNFVLQYYMALFIKTIGALKYCKNISFTFIKRFVLHRPNAV